jgi:hypothetical protein
LTTAKRTKSSAACSLTRFCRHLRTQAELEAAVGFRRVIDVLIEAKKPVVGHNLLLDLVHTLSFLQLPPPTSDQFKSQLHSLFPTCVNHPQHTQCTISLSLSLTHSHTLTGLWTPSSWSAARPSW